MANSNALMPRRPPRPSDADIEYLINLKTAKALGLTVPHESGNGPSVWTGRALQAESDDLEVVGLALPYPALERNVCVPGHDGYPRALDLIRDSAPKAIWAT
jgi:hypothetical protein